MAAAGRLDDHVRYIVFPNTRAVRVRTRTLYVQHAVYTSICTRTTFRVYTDCTMNHEP